MTPLDPSRSNQDGRPVEDAVVRPDRLELPSDLADLDARLGDLLGRRSGADSDPGLVNRIFEASRGDLPPRVIPIETSPAWRFRRVAAGLGAVAAAIAVAVLADRALDVAPPADTSRDVAMVTSDPLEDLALIEPRDSEVMLVAVLDPGEVWFDDGELDDLLDAEPVLHSRMFGVEELEGTVFAMLGGPTS